VGVTHVTERPFSWAKYTPGGVDGHPRRWSRRYARRGKEAPLDGSDALVFWAVVGARVLVPLAVFRFPLPAMLAALVVDGLDQSIFQTLTSLSLESYQSYDKALDVYYLSLAYLAMHRNWVSRPAFDVGRFLYYYRLVGVALFEQTQIRVLLLIFPNTFEYVFDAYEAIRTRWDPRRLARAFCIGLAAFIWIVIKLPQEWWIHVAELDATDIVKEQAFGVAADTPWPEAIAAAPWVVVLVIVAILGLLGVARWLLAERLPPADHPFTLDADAHQPMVDGDAVEAVRRRIDERIVDLELLEKVVLIALVSLIFSRMLPGADPTATLILVGVAVVVLANTLVSSLLARIRERPRGALRSFLVTLALNVAIVIVGQVVLDVLPGAQFEHALVFVLLLSIIVTAYDRYRPLYKARFADGPLAYPGPELRQAGVTTPAGVG
jgi:hypothetical protein